MHADHSFRELDHTWLVHNARLQLLRTHKAFRVVIQLSEADSRHCHMNCALSSGVSPAERCGKVKNAGSGHTSLNKKLRQGTTYLEATYASGAFGTTRGRGPGHPHRFRGGQISILLQRTTFIKRLMAQGFLRPIGNITTRKCSSTSIGPSKQHLQMKYY